MNVETIPKGFKYVDLKKHVMNEAGKKLVSNGYKMIKSQECFTKTNSSGKIDIAFGFLNFHPLDYKFHFSITIWIKTIQDAVKYFYDSMNISEPVKWCTTFWEGDFINTHKELDWKFRVNYYNVVKSPQEADHLLEKSLTILVEKAIPLADSISTFESFRDYYLNNRPEIVKNFASDNLFVSILMAAFITEKSSFYSLSKYLKSKLVEKKKDGVYYSGLFSLLEKLDSFVSSS